MQESEKWKGSRSVVSNSSRPHGLQPTRHLRPWDFPGESARVGCHCLLRKDTLVTLNLREELKFLPRHILIPTKHGFPIHSCPNSHVTCCSTPLHFGGYLSGASLYYQSTSLWAGRVKDALSTAGVMAVPTQRRQPQAPSQQLSVVHIKGGQQLI